MTLEPRHPPIVPSYGSATLADLSSSILASLDPDAPPEQNVLGLAPAQRACLLIVDGLGWELLRDHPAVAPFLSELARNSRPITAGFPATTVTSLGSLCTGLPPGQHGMLGYKVLVPGEDILLNALRWDSRIDPRQWQSRPTIYERATAAGIEAVHVALGAFRGTGLTVATQRGASYRPADSMGALAAQGAAAVAENGRAFVTVYHGDLDNTGHMFGVGSDAWYNQLAHVDKLAEQLASALPARTSLYVTADHGMVDVGPEDRIDVDEIPELRAGVAVLGGEARARHVYARAGRRRGCPGHLARAAGRPGLGHVQGRGDQGRLVRPGGPAPGRPDRRRRGRAVGLPRHRRHQDRAAGVRAVRHARLAHLRRPVRSRAEPSVHLTGRDGLLVSPAALAEELADEPAPVLLDVRWRLGGPPGLDSYREGHLPGAVFVDLDRDLAGPPGPAGRHPLPDPAAFTDAMRGAGVSRDRPVIVYDDRDATAAARGWWLLRYYGHENVRVLDGGYQAWLAAGLPVSRRARRNAGRLHRAARPHAGAGCGRCRIGGADRAAARRAGGGAVPGRDRSPSTRWRATSPARSARRPLTT